MKRWNDKNGRAVMKFNAQLTEDIRNDEFMLFVKENGKGVVKKFPNGEYKNMNAKGMFNKDTPFWGGKFIPMTGDAVQYIQDTYSTEIYRSQLFTKIVKRKYAPTTFSPIFYNKNGDKFDGLIPKGSIVEVFCEEQTYTKANKMFRKLELRGVTVIQENIGEEIAEVQQRNLDDSEVVTTQTVDLTEVLKELEVVKKQNAALNKHNKALTDGVIELNENFNNVMGEMKEIIVGLRDEVVNLKEEINSLQVNKNTIECTKELNEEDSVEETEAYVDYYDEEYFDKEFSGDDIDLGDNSDDDEEDVFDIPF